jgi:hypothetical protein
VRKPLRGVRRRLGEYLSDLPATRSVVSEVQVDVEAVRREVAELSASVSHVGDALAELQRTLQELADRSGAGEARVLEALLAVYDREPENRRRLAGLRQSEDYEPAYAEREPLVSVVIPTYTSHETLRERSIPSVLAQTYSNWEVVVMGDAAPPEAAEVVASFGDERLRYDNLLIRGPYPDDRHAAWLVTGVPPFNAGMRLARGRWIAPLADDDALWPEALERLVAEAQERRLELCYSLQNYIDRDSESRVFGEFPPSVHRFGLQGSILHSGLRFFEQELADATFMLPSDWSWVRRMLRAGVRIGMVDEVLCDYYPSYRGET